MRTLYTLVKFYLIWKHGKVEYKLLQEGQMDHKERAVEWFKFIFTLSCQRIKNKQTKKKTWIFFKSFSINILSDCFHFQDHLELGSSAIQYFQVTILFTEQSSKYPLHFIKHLKTLNCHYPDLGFLLSTT